MPAHHMMPSTAANHALESTNAQITDFDMHIYNAAAACNMHRLDKLEYPRACSLHAVSNCRQESFFHYLFGVEEEDYFGAIDLRTQQTILFMPRLPQAYSVWMGHIHGPEHMRERYAVDDVFYTEQMPDKLAELDPPALHVLHGVNSDR